MPIGSEKQLLMGAAGVAGGNYFGDGSDVTSGSGKCDVYTFFTLDAGATWYGFQAGADLS
jgi:hypothetical protein